jgi:methionine sulfoxide reductase heme-binding subunit
MNLKFRRLLFIILLICPYFLVFGIIMNTHPGDSLNTALRFSGLFGFLSLSLGVIMNLLKKEIKSVIGQPFIIVHHIFVITGLILITIHPLSLALSFNDFSIFIPDTSSVYLFLLNGGRFAIFLIYLGFFAAVFRSVLKGRWIQIHRIVYLALILVIIHANLIGEDLFDPVIRVLFNVIAGIVIIAGLVKIRARHHLVNKFPH